ncbi:hypothetical protein [Sulfurospirillum arcachonense]|uniref:hypothetical protein n=1 Tax=Sulfurospirillum arcachonense TaxID=57666 RepID=UPI00046913B1|nr:hypothetical protein [Sulfurospirillum arcachonense]
MIKPNHMEIEKIYKTKDIIPALKYYGNSFDKIKTKYPERAKALILGYRVNQSGLNEEQILSVVENKIQDREITDLLGYKEIKSIRSWSVSSQLKQEEKELETLRVWCMKLGAICLLGNLTQKDIIELAKKQEELDCSVPKEF